MQLRFTAIVGFASAALASPAPPKTLEWVVQTSQCAHLLTAAYGPNGPDILQQMNTAVVTDINRIQAGATLSLPPVSFPDRASVSTRVEASATQEFLVIAGTCEPPVDPTTTYTSPSTTGKTVTRPTASTASPPATTPTPTSTASSSPSTDILRTGALGAVCDDCTYDAADRPQEDTTFSCDCGGRTRVTGRLSDYLVLYESKLVLHSSPDDFSESCNILSLEDYKVEAECGNERPTPLDIRQPNKDGNKMFVRQISDGRGQFYLGSVYLENRAALGQAIKGGTS